jgi:hypothetical protein
MRLWRKFEISDEHLFYFPVRLKLSGVISCNQLTLVIAFGHC